MTQRCHSIGHFFYFTQLKPQKKNSINKTMVLGMHPVMHHLAFVYARL